jgi:hypothetical protein
MDASFPLCDPNKDNKITKQEMTACAVPESLDTKKEGVLTVYSEGRFCRYQERDQTNFLKVPPGLPPDRGHRDRQLSFSVHVRLLQTL